MRSRNCGTGEDVQVNFVPMREVQADCVDWALEIAEDFVPDLVIFLAKSGFMFADPMAACFGCDMVDIEVSRPSNNRKDAIAKAVPRVPKWLLAAALKSKTMYGYHDRNSERELLRTDRYKAVDFSNHRNVLIVDDSIDTGWSMLEAVKAVREDAPECDIRIASYCVVDGSESRITADYWRFKNAIVVTATSRYSSEHLAFLEAYGCWRDGVCENGR